MDEVLTERGLLCRHHAIRPNTCIQVDVHLVSKFNVRCITSATLSIRRATTLQTVEVPRAPQPSENQGHGES
ncbi:hypothetical protein CITRIK5_70726 [Citricoccus sp. K5]|nr:hypothetical protein CITRIK5_70726 [Citricoccus sp. K5]